MCYVSFPTWPGPEEGPIAKIPRPTFYPNIKVEDSVDHFIRRISSTKPNSTSETDRLRSIIVNEIKRLMKEGDSGNASRLLDQLEKS
jgi:hypothetical protein